MERENKKVSIVYILTGIVLLLIIYLGLFVYRTFNPIEEDNQTTLPEVASSCTFDMTMNDFNNIANNTDLCGNLNKINLTDVKLNGKNLDVSVYYSSSAVKQMGVYINGNVVMSDNVAKVHSFGVFDNKLFITDVSEQEASFSVFDANGTNIYSLKDALNTLQISDQNIGAVLSSKNVDGNSFKFADGQVTFNSTSRTCSNNVSGSSYTITYKGTIFETPSYVANVAC